MELGVHRVTLLLVRGGHRGEKNFERRRALRRCFRAPSAGSLIEHSPFLLTLSNDGRDTVNLGAFQNADNGFNFRRPKTLHQRSPTPAMREIVSIQGGQCGNQIGATLLTLAAAPHSPPLSPLPPLFPPFLRRAARALVPHHRPSPSTARRQVLKDIHLENLDKERNKESRQPKGGMGDR